MACNQDFHFQKQQLSATIIFYAVESFVSDLFTGQKFQKKKLKKNSGNVITQYPYQLYFKHYFILLKGKTVCL